MVPAFPVSAFPVSHLLPVLSSARAHTHTHARARAHSHSHPHLHARARAHTHTHTQAASVRLQTMAKGIELLVTLPVLGAEGDTDDVFSPQAVAVIVTAYQRMGLRDDALFHSLTSVVKALPAEDFDAQALANIANSYVVCGIMDSDMFTKLAAAASALTADRWNPTALSLFVNALVRADMKDDNLSRDMALLHQLADMQCEMYAAQGSRAFSSPAIMAQLLSSLVAANVQHVRLFTCASVVVTEHFRLGSPEPQVGNLLLPTV